MNPNREKIIDLDLKKEIDWIPENLMDLTKVALPKVTDLDQEKKMDQDQEKVMDPDLEKKLRQIE